MNDEKEINESKKKQGKEERVRNWAFIQYDDSAPKNWREILDNLKVPWVESPLHDADLDVTGEKKKAHRHIVIAFENKKSFNQVQAISDLVSHCKVEKVANMRGYIRYLAHLDNPEKAQYSTEDIICHCGFEKDNYLRKSSSDVLKTLKEIFQYINENKIESYSDFIDALIREERDDWFDVATTKHTLPVTAYIRAYAYKHLEEDPVTGEMKYVGEYMYKTGGNNHVKKDMPVMKAIKEEEKNVKK